MRPRIVPNRTVRRSGGAWASWATALPSCVMTTCSPFSKARMSSERRPSASAILTSIHCDYSRGESGVRLEPFHHRSGVAFGVGGSDVPVRGTGDFPKPGSPRVDGVQFAGVPDRDVDVRSAVDEKDGSVGGAHGVDRGGAPQIYTVAHPGIEEPALDHGPEHSL